MQDYHNLYDPDLSVDQNSTYRQDGQRAADGYWVARCCYPTGEPSPCPGGATGPTGPTGSTGAQGEAGATGATGPTGSGVSACAEPAYLVVASEYEGSVGLFDPVTRTVVQNIQIGGELERVAADPYLRRIYVADAYSQSLLVIDADTGQQTAAIPLTGVVTDIAVNLATHMVYVGVSSDASDYIAVINGLTSAMADYIPLNEEVTSISVDSRKNLIFAAGNGYDYLYTISGNTNAVIRTNTFGCYSANRLRTDSCSGLVYSLEDNGNTIRVIDGETGALVGSLYLATGVSSFDIDTSSRLLYALSNTTDQMIVLDLCTGLQVADISLPDRAHNDVVVDSGNHMVYVGTYDSSSIELIDGTSKEYLGSYTMTSGADNHRLAALGCPGDCTSCCEGSAEDPCSRTAYTFLQSGNSIWMYNPNSGQVENSLLVGSFAVNGMAADPVLRKLYVTNGTSDRLEIYNVDNRRPEGSVALTYDSSPLLGAPAVNPVTHAVYVPDAANNRIYVLDGETEQIQQTFFVSSPLAVSVNSQTNRIYVERSGSQPSAVLDALTGQQIGELSGFNSYEGNDSLAADVCTNQIFAIQSHYLIVFDGESNTFTKGLDNRWSYVQLALDPSAHRLFALRQDESSIDVFSTCNGEPIGTIETDAASGGEMWVDPGSHVLNVPWFVSFGEAGSGVFQYDTRTLQAMEGIDTAAIGGVSAMAGVGCVPDCGCDCGATGPTGPTGATGAQGEPGATGPTGPTGSGTNACAQPAYGYVSVGNGVEVFDPQTHDVLTVIPTQNNDAMFLASDPTLRQVYAVDTSTVTPQLFIIDGDTNTVKQTVGLNLTSLTERLGQPVVNTRTHKIYIPDLNNDEILVLDGRTGTFLGRVSVNPDIQSLAVNPRANLIYVINSGGVDVINGATETVTRALVDSSVENITDAVLDACSNMLFMSSISGEVGVRVYDASTMALIGRITEGAWAKIALDEGRNILYLANNSEIKAISICTGTQLWSQPIDAGGFYGIGGLAVDTVNQIVHLVTENYSPRPDDTSYYAFSGIDGATITSIADGAERFDGTTLACEPDCGCGCGCGCCGGTPAPTAISNWAQPTYGYFSNGSTVSEIDPATQALRASVTVPGAAPLLASDPTLRQVYATDNATGSLILLSGDPLTAGRAVALNGGNPMTLGTPAVNPKTHKIYVPDLDGRRIIVVDGVTGAELQIISIGKDIYDLTVNPAENMIYVGTGSGTDYISGATDAVIAAGMLYGGATVRVQANPCTNDLYLQAAGSGDILVWNAENASESGVIPLTGEAQGWAIDPKRNALYVISDQLLTALNLCTGAALWEYAFEDRYLARRIALDQVNQVLHVLADDADGGTEGIHYWFNARNGSQIAGAPVSGNANSATVLASDGGCGCSCDSASPVAAEPAAEVAVAPKPVNLLTATGAQQQLSANGVPALVVF
ncbi:MAG: hypothetical protein LBQ33_02060, partial [Oscillospiraceae bacterium]|nr:hypothetical protein [Oscillospiraceae bacterium]